jgi:hypothetical protein
MLGAAGVVLDATFIDPVHSGRAGQRRDRGVPFPRRWPEGPPAP